jgi:UDP-glucose 4-epimerase
MKNILVTGGAGYIGSHIVEKLVKKKFLKIFIVDDLSTGHKRLINKKATFIKANINKTKLIKKIILKNKIDTIIHLAAKTIVTESEKKPKLYYKVNVLGTKSLLNAAKNSLVKNFLFSSTAAVYGSKIRYVNENSKTFPDSIYGKTKLQAENLVKRNFKKNYIILRYFNVVGASPSKKIGLINRYGQLFKNFAVEILKNKPKLSVYGKDYDTKDGTCIRDFIHVNDLAEIHLKVLLKVSKNNKSVILNCGYGKGFSVLEVVNNFKKFSKNKVTVKFEKRRKAEIVESIANVTKLKNYLKWKPKFFNLNKMIQNSIDWEKKLVRK